MPNISLRPDLRTSGGEVNDVVLNGKYAGTLTLVYREGDRISGSIQLDKESMSPSDKEAVIEFTQHYVQSLIDALNVEDCDVLVTYSKYDHVIATDHNIGEVTEMVEDAFEYEDEEDDYGYYTSMDDEGEMLLDLDGDEDEAVYFELVIVGESRNKVEYHVYSDTEVLVAEALMTISGSDVIGEVNWMYPPEEQESDAVADLIVSDFDDNEIDTFLIDMEYEGEIFDTIELTHRDLLDAQDTLYDLAANDDEEDETAYYADDEDEDDDELIYYTDDDDDDDYAYYADDDDDDEDLEVVEIYSLDDEDDDYTSEEIDDELTMYADDDDDELAEEDYTVVLARDDQDVLTYEIYQQSYGGLPIGTATVDISTHQITGFIDFREPGNGSDREFIATMLMQELDKERDYDSVNFTMMYNNETIDEVMFELDQYH
ncbi:hypothetical protein SY83_20515 [Paenibacillus swuensis]|uniref:Uncharacterized protein n=2 Tax=Paenibacillus swuensis TaxID=1178515 RepID=A0A172TMI4_9BACL|nr:hypothetical protein SY83_20515 [Paenibacillus swuensis]